MKSIIVDLILLVIAVIAVVMFIGNVFTPFKSNQELLASTNLNLNSTLNAELEASQNYDSNHLTSFINTYVGSSVVEIHVDGTKWNGQAQGSGSNITVGAGASYTRTVSSSGGKTIYSFTSIS